MTKKMILQFGDICLTLMPDDIEMVTTKLALRLGREPTSGEFADAMLSHMTENARLTRTVLHN
jgi:hypothetical protein